MFYLRKISGDNVEINITIGPSYTLIDKELNPEEFAKMNKMQQWDDCIYAFIAGNEILPLSDKQKSFVMTGDGQTFANVSKR